MKWARIIDFDLTSMRAPFFRRSLIGYSSLGPREPQLGLVRPAWIRLAYHATEWCCDAPYPWEFPAKISLSTKECNDSVKIRFIEISLKKIEQIFTTIEFDHYYGFDCVDSVSIALIALLQWYWLVWLVLR